MGWIQAATISCVGLFPMLPRWPAGGTCCDGDTARSRYPFLYDPARIHLHKPHIRPQGIDRNVVSNDPLAAASSSRFWRIVDDDPTPPTGHSTGESVHNGDGDGEERRTFDLRAMDPVRGPGLNSSRLLFPERLGGPVHVVFQSFATVDRRSPESRTYGRPVRTQRRDRDRRPGESCCGRRKPGARRRRPGLWLW